MRFYFTQCSLVATVLAFQLVQPSLVKSTNFRNGKLEQRITGVRGKVLNVQLSFPDIADYTFSEAVSPGLTPSPCPDGNSICETADDYPMNHIKAVMQRQPEYLLQHFYDEVITPSQRQPKHLLRHFYDEEDNVLVNRQGFTPEIREHESLCVSTEKKIFPKKVENSEGLFHVVNDDQYKQGVKVDICAKNNREVQCQIPGSLAIGYKAVCVQKSIDRVLVVLDNRNSSSVVPKPFPIPTCCSCELVTTTMNTFGSRVGHRATNFYVPRKARNFIRSSSP